MKNAFLKSVSGVIKQACVIFTCIVFAFYIFADLTNGSNNFLTLKMLFLLFLAAIWFAMTDVLLVNKNLNIFLRVSLHFISSTVGFYLIFIYLSGYAKKSSKSFILVILFAVIYILIASIALFIRHLLLKKKADNENYESIYDNKK